MKVIHLDEAQATLACSTAPDGSRVEPVPYHAGGFILGLPVLDDPAHADLHEFLSSLPQIDYVPPPAEELA